MVWRDLSLDLVAAPLRQRNFALKITGHGGQNTPFARRRAVIRYHKFILLMDRRSPAAGKALVPTLDIDLCWHTHQLFPTEYRNWCLEHVGRPINHDDTISKTNLAEGLRNTSLAWLKAYQDGYTTTDLRRGYFSRTRILAGTMFPPYGLYMIWKGRALKQARLGMIP
jgi:Glycine-rich domain-containing protein-like